MKKTNPISAKEIGIIAENLREEFKIKKGSFFPIYDVITFYMEIGVLTVQVMDNEDPMFEDDIPALYSPYDNFIYIKESILEDYENNEYRANFTLAHEFFHFLQHKVLNFTFEEVDECKAYFDPEWQANEFAAQLLIPNEYIDMEVNEIVDKFHVSEICATTRKLKMKRRLNK